MAAPKTIDFFKGHATLGLLPSDQIAAAYDKILKEEPYPHYQRDAQNTHPLHYGTDPGNLRIRENVVKWANGKFGRTQNDPNKINLTGGASYGAANILTSCTSFSVTIQAFAVSPTYFLINYAFMDAGFEGKMTAIKETPGEKYDIDIDRLETRLKELDAENGLQEVKETEVNIFEDPTGRGPRKMYRYVMYLVPTFSNPGAITYSVQTRKKLLEVARKHDLLLICDDVYDYLCYDLQPKVPKLSHLDEDSLPDGFKYGNTVSNCSFSKIIAPGLRVGWQETATPLLAKQLASTGANISGGTPGQLSTFVVNNFILSGELDKSIEVFANAFKSRAQTLRSAVAKHLPVNHMKFYGGDGGYFCWVYIDSPNFDLEQTLKIVQEKHSVRIPNGNFFEVAGDPVGWGKSGARLCVALLTEEEIEEGIEKWGSVIRSLHPELY